MEKNKILFERSFAPQEGLVKQHEKPYRDELCLNGYWDFSPLSLDKDLEIKDIIPSEVPSNLIYEDVEIKVPSPWNVNDYSNGEGGDYRCYPTYKKSWESANAGWMTKKIVVPENWTENQILLHFEAVAGYSKVFVNGQPVAENFDYFLPFTANITNYLKADSEVSISVWIAAAECFCKKGRFGYLEHLAGSFWGEHILGIWQDVYLQKMPNIYVEDIFVKPNLDSNMLDLEITLNNTTATNAEFALNGSVNLWHNKTKNTILEKPEIDYEISDLLLDINDTKYVITPNSSKVITLSIDTKSKLPTWSPDAPNLLVLLLDLMQNGKKIDVKFQRFGWKSVKLKKKKLFLNGEEITLKGDSWHFTGVPQMTRRYAYAWYTMLKDANANTVRLHAQVYPRFYLEMADELGMLILDETSIWWSNAKINIESENYYDASNDHVKRMVLRDRNYPSVMGWSVCNETLEVTQMVFHAPKSVLKRNAAAIDKWVDITRENDSTRDWISGDGEFGVKTKLPTRIMHYTVDIETFGISLMRKPWGVGETGMGYYGTPAQLSKINGDRSFESQQGRMEGVAGEAYDLIKVQRKFGAVYTSVFNVVWYGLKPLALGLKDVSLDPTLEDGIFFSDYVEGIPGYQPERIGPFSSTLNPGYEIDKPMYETWPLFDAVKAGFADDYKSFNNTWRKKKDTTIKCESKTSKQGNVWVSTNEDSQTKKHIEDLGLILEPLEPQKIQMIIVDGSNPPIDIKCIKTLRQCVNNGSDILVLNTTEIAKKFIDTLSDQSIEIYPREATSYLVNNLHPIIKGESHGSYYFSETMTKPVSHYSIGGDWVQEDNVILNACHTDWQKWNYQPENTKTASLYRDELKHKNPDSVIVRRELGKGEIIVSTLDYFSLPMTYRKMVCTMFRNLGAPIKNKMVNHLEAINWNRKLSNTQLITCKNGIASEVVSKEIVKSNSTGHIVTSNNNEYDNYLKFYIYSPQSLVDLLIEPHVPKFKLHIIGDVADIIIKGELIGKEYLEKKANKTSVTLPLDKGWNDISIKIGDKSSEAKIKAWFTSSRRNYYKGVKTAVEK